MTATPEVGQTPDEGQSAEQRQTSPSKESQEASRIAALLRERFGIKR